MNALELLYQGKAKSAYLTEDQDLLVLKFRDDTSAFDGEIIEQLSEKGAVNNQLNAFIFFFKQKTAYEIGSGLVGSACR